MNEQIQRIKNKLLTRRSLKENNPYLEIIYLHHILMREYGWIPLEEFKSLPIQTVLDLVDLIAKDKEAEKKAYSKGRK
jgi:hypothetical protein